MKKVTLFIAAAFFSTQLVNAQPSHSAMVPNQYAAYFTEAYAKYPSVPVGILEAVAFNHTRFNHMTHDANEPQSCTGIPLAYGVMGLTLDGKSYFHNNLLLIAQLSGISKEDIITSPEKNILAYAAAYAAEKQKLNITSANIEDQVAVLKALSELPDSTAGQQYALNSDIYVMFTFLNNAAYQKFYNLPTYNIDIKKVFGEATYNLLTSPTNSIEKINDNRSGSTENSHKAMGSGADYSGAIWNPAASCNYTVGRTMGITAIVIHDMEGSYAASISWFQNCSSVVSAHYCIRSSDGQITQMVHEADKAWHVGSENGYTVGIEHEGYAAKTGWYTDTMYGTSSRLVRTHICPAYGILKTRVAFWPWAAATDYSSASIPGACTLIKGHQHYPNQTHTDPGINWDWDYYYKLINDTAAKQYTWYTATTGNFYDDGGASGNYSNDESALYVFAPTGAKTVTMSFSSYNTESTWDYMYIYDGDNVNAPLIGTYTGTTGPGTVTSTGSKMCVEFRSDCATTETGWAATWTGNSVTGIASNMGDNAVKIFPNPFSSALNITTDNGNVDIALYDMLGREVISERNASSINHSATLDTQSLPNGVYFVKVTGTELSYTEKVVKN